MKKILVLFALLMTGVMGIHAQEGLKWGAMAGMNSSKFSTKKPFSRYIQVSILP